MFSPSALVQRDSHQVVMMRIVCSQQKSSISLQEGAAGKEGLLSALLRSWAGVNLVPVTLRVPL